MPNRTPPPIPDGMINFMKDLSKNVIKEKPENIYNYAAKFFEGLLMERDGSLDKGYGRFRSYNEYCKAMRKYEIKRIKFVRKSDEESDSGVASGNTDDEATKVRNKKLTNNTTKPPQPKIDMEIKGNAIQAASRNKKGATQPKKTKNYSVSPKFKQQGSFEMDKKNKLNVVGNTLNSKRLNNSKSENDLASRKARPQPRKLSSKKPSENLIVITEETSVDIGDTENNEKNSKAANTIKSAFRAFVNKKKSAAIEADRTKEIQKDAAAHVIQRMFKKHFGTNKSDLKNVESDMNTENIPSQDIEEEVEKIVLTEGTEKQNAEEIMKEINQEVEKNKENQLNENENKILENSNTTSDPQINECEHREKIPEKYDGNNDIIDKEEIEINRERQSKVSDEEVKDILKTSVEEIEALEKVETIKNILPSEIIENSDLSYNQQQISPEKKKFTEINDLNDPSKQSETCSDSGLSEKSFNLNISEQADVPANDLNINEDDNLKTFSENQQNVEIAEPEIKKIESIKSMSAKNTIEETVEVDTQPSDDSQINKEELLEINPENNEETTLDEPSKQMGIDEIVTLPVSLEIKPKMGNEEILNSVPKSNNSVVSSLIYKFENSQNGCDSVQNGKTNVKNDDFGKNENKLQTEIVTKNHNFDQNLIENETIKEINENAKIDNDMNDKILKSIQDGIKSEQLEDDIKVVQEPEQDPPIELAKPTISGSDSPQIEKLDDNSKSDSQDNCNLEISKNQTSGDFFGSKPTNNLENSLNVEITNEKKDKENQMLKSIEDQIIHDESTHSDEVSNSVTQETQEQISMAEKSITSEIKNTDNTSINSMQNVPVANAAATLIQKIFRGFNVRRKFDKKKFYKMELSEEKIQKTETNEKNSDDEEALSAVKKLSSTDDSSKVEEIDSLSNSFKNEVTIKLDGEKQNSTENTEDDGKENSSQINEVKTIENNLPEVEEICLAKTIHTVGAGALEPENSEKEIENNVENKENSLPEIEQLCSENTVDTAITDTIDTIKEETLVKKNESYEDSEENLIRQSDKKELQNDDLIPSLENNTNQISGQVNITAEIENKNEKNLQEETDNNNSISPKQNNAATHIQAAYRGYRTRKNSPIGKSTNPSTNIQETQIDHKKDNKEEIMSVEDYLKLESSNKNAVTPISSNSPKDILGEEIIQEEHRIPSHVDFVSHISGTRTLSGILENSNSSDEEADESSQHMSRTRKQSYIRDYSRDSDNNIKQRQFSQSNSIAEQEIVPTESVSSDLSESDEIQKVKFKESEIDESSGYEQDLSEIEKFDFSSCGEDSLEAMYYSLRKNEIMLDRMHKQAQVQRNGLNIDQNNEALDKFDEDPKKEIEDKSVGKIENVKSHEGALDIESDNNNNQEQKGINVNVDGLKSINSVSKEDSQSIKEIVNQSPVTDVIRNESENSKYEESIQSGITTETEENKTYIQKENVVDTDSSSIIEDGIKEEHESQSTSKDKSFSQNEEMKEINSTASTSENNNQKIEEKDELNSSPSVKSKNKNDMEMNQYSIADPKKLYRSITTVDDVMSPIAFAMRQREQFQNQMHGLAHHPSLDRSLTKDSEEYDEFIDESVQNIKRNLLTSTISEADSDYFEPTTRRLHRDDFNISTAFDRVTSSDSDSTIISAATKIQAGARGFLTRRRLRRSSAGTSMSIDPQCSFGNTAIDKSLDDLIEQQELNNLEEAAVKIQRSYRNYMSRKAKTDRGHQMQSMMNDESMYLSDESTDGLDDQLGVREIKLEQRKVERDVDNNQCVKALHQLLPSVGDESENYKNIIVSSDENVTETDVGKETNDANGTAKIHHLSIMNFDVLDTAQRRMTLQRGDAVQRNSTPEDIELQLQRSNSCNNVDAGKLEVVKIDKMETEELKKRDYRRLGPRQRSMPVQIDTEFMRIIPKHLRKRIKSADMIRRK